MYTDASNRWIVMLPRCQNLQYVDLTQVSASNPKFSGLKKTISELHELKALALPRKLKLTINNNPASEWPPQLRQLSLAIGDLLDARVFQEFEWPPSLTGFTVNWSSDLCEESLELALCSQEGFRTSLWSLHIHWRIPDFFFNFDTTDLLYRLPNLVLLRTSVTLINWTWMDTPPPGRTSLPLRILELTGGWPWPDDEGYMINWLF